MSAAWGTHLLVLALAGTLLMGVVQGFRAGLIRSAFSLVGLVLAFYLARPVAAKIHPHLEDHLQFDGAYALTVFGSFLAIALVAWLVGLLVAKLIAWTPLVWLDRLGGVALGLVLALLISGLLLGFLQRMAVMDDLLAAASDWEHSFLVGLQGLAPDLYRGWPSDLDPSQIQQLKDNI